MFHIDILAQRSDDSASVPIRGLNQGIALGVIPRSVNSVAKGHADETKSQMIGECSPTLEMPRRDGVYVRIWPKFMDGDQILVYAGIVCPGQFV